MAVMESATAETGATTGVVEVHQENCALLFMLDRYKTLLYDPTILALSLLIPAYFCLFCLKKQKKQNCSFPDATAGIRSGRFVQPQRTDNSLILGLSYRCTRDCGVVVFKKKVVLP